MYKFSGKKFTIGDVQIECKNAIKKVIEYDKLYVIFMMENIIPRNNILAINDKGEIIWNIKDIINLLSDEPYVAASKAGENEITIISASGIRYLINVYTNQIIKKQIVK